MKNPLNKHCRKKSCKGCKYLACEPQWIVSKGKYVTKNKCKNRTRTIGASVKGIK